MKRHYQLSRQHSTKRGKCPLFEYSMPLTDEEWRHLLQWVERSNSGLTNQLFKENENEDN